jgi:predicted secreted protein
MAIQYSSNFEQTVPFSDTCAQVALQANVEEIFALPGDATTKYQLRFTYTSTSNVFVRKNDTPTIPAGGTVGTEQYNEFRPGSDGSKRYAQGGDVIHLITPDATAYVGIAVSTVPY